MKFPETHPLGDLCESIAFQIRRPERSECVAFAQSKDPDAFPFDCQWRVKQRRQWPVRRLPWTGGNLNASRTAWTGGNLNASRTGLATQVLRLGSAKRQGKSRPSARLAQDDGILKGISQGSPFGWRGNDRRACVVRVREPGLASAPEAASHVPKFHLGTPPLSREILFRAVIVSIAPRSAMKLPQQARSQMKFGNEVKKS
jgi:hypothetical protein